MKAVIEIKSRGIYPYIMEFLDKEAVDISVKNVKTKIKGEGHMLLVSVDVPKEASERILNELEDCIRTCHGVRNVFKARSMSEAEALGLFDIRRSYHPATIQAANKYKKTPESKVLLLMEDIAVPPSKLVEAVKRIKEASAKYNVPMVVGGHIGDGNLHPTTWFDVTDEDMKHRVEGFYREVMKIAIELGGTISAEHGIGLAKKEGLRMEFEAKNSLKALDIMRDIKRIFDPKGILNPGKVF